MSTASSIRIAAGGDDRPTVADIVTAYLRHVTSQKVLGAAALADRKATLNEFVQELGPRPVEDCKAFHLSDFIEARSDRWKTGSTKAGRARAVNAAFNWAVKQERIARNPFRSIKYQESERRPEMTDADLEKIILRVQPEMEDGFVFLRHVACRLSEMCDLNWTDVDLERREVIFREPKEFRHTGKHRVMWLDDVALALLARLLAEAEAECSLFAGLMQLDGPVFRNSRGRRWHKNTWGQNLRRLIKSHNLDIAARTHGVRHQFATVAAINGASAKDIAEALGHTTTTITEKHYMHVRGNAQMQQRAARLAAPRPGTAEAPPPAADAQIPPRPAANQPPEPIEPQSKEDPAA